MLNKKSVDDINVKGKKVLVLSSGQTKGRAEAGTVSGTGSGTSV